MKVLEWIKNNPWAWIKKNPGKALSAGVAVAAAAGYTVAPWVDVLANLIGGGQ